MFCLLFLRNIINAKEQKHAFEDKNTKTNAKRNKNMIDTETRTKRKTQKTMPVKIGINGFGRIGRLVTRAAAKNPNAEIVAINDPFMDLEYMVYLLKYDSVHGIFAGEVTHKDGKLIIDGRSIAIFSEKDPTQIPWGSVDTDVVCE